MNTVLNVIKLMLPLMFFIILNAGVATLCNRSFGKMIPITMCWASFALYLSQFFFGTFQFGFIVLYGLSIASLLYLFILLAKKRECSFALSPGLIAFIVIYFTACFTLSGKSFADWDEFTHWGLMVKESLRLDRFYCVPESRLIWHKDYPPLACLNELVFAKIAGYSEGHVTIGMQVFTLSFFIPELTEKITGTDRVEKKNFMKVLICSLSLLVVILMFEYSVDLWPQKIINSILPDVLLSFMFAFLCIKVMEWDGKDTYFLVSFISVSSALVLIKQVGIAFFFVALFMLVLKQICLKLENKSGVGVLKFLLYDLVLVVVPIVCMGSWSVYKSRYIKPDDFSYMNGQFNLRQIDLRTFVETVVGKTGGIQGETFKNYVKALITKQINNVSAIPLTYVSACALFILFIIVAVCFLNKLNSKTGIMLGTSMVVGAVGYAFMMAVLYTFCFPDNEKETLAGFTRYMDSFIMGEILILLAIYIPMMLDIIGKEKTTIAVFSLALASVCFLNTSNLINILPRRGMNNPYSMYQNYARQISENVPSNAKVFIVYDKEQTPYPQWWDPMQLFVQYYNNDVDICENYTGAFAADYTEKTNREMITSEMAKNDYLYVINTCNNFNDNLRKYNNGNNFEENSFYRIISDGETLVSFQKEASVN